MKRYPAACPVFEVIAGDEHVPVGAIVEGLAEAEGAPFAGSIPGAIVLRVADDRDVQTSDPHYVLACVRHLGFVVFACYPAHLRPLTPAAVEMLALVSK